MHMTDADILKYPLAVRKLGLFVMEVYLGFYKKAAEKPLAISVKNVRQGITLVVGIQSIYRQNLRKK